LQAVHFVALIQQEFGEVGAVLTGDAGDQCPFHLRSAALLSIEYTISSLGRRFEAAASLKWASSEASGRRSAILSQVVNIHFEPYIPAVRTINHIPAPFLKFRLSSRLGSGKFFNPKRGETLRFHVWHLRWRR